ncbi:MAG: TRAP transporter substrate-binding protein [Christensenella sp.]
MKKLVALALAILACLSLVACGTASVTADTQAAETQAPTVETTTPAPAANGEYDLTGCEALKITLPLPNGVTAVDTVYTEKWMALITERSGGLITFDYTNSAALGSALELMEGVDMGTYDMSVIDLANFDAYVPQVDALCLPFIIKDWDHAEKVYLGEPNQWVADLVSQKMDITILGDIGMGFRSVISKDPLYTIDDCKDYLIRTPDLQLYIDALGTLGFSCTSLAFSETYSAMQSGVIDGMETTLNVLYDNGYYDVGKYILQTRHFFACSEAIVNTTFWDSLPDVYRQIIMDSFQEIEAEAWAYARSVEESLVPKFKEKGVEVNEFSDADHTKIKELFSDYWKEKAGTMGDGALEMVETLAALQ